MTSRRLGLPPEGGTLREIADVARRLAQGRSQAVTSVTLTANAATTVVSHPFLSEASVVLLSPRTASAAQEVGNGTIWISAKANGGVTLTHANNATADRTFDVSWIG